MHPDEARTTRLNRRSLKDSDVDGVLSRADVCGVGTAPRDGVGQGSEDLKACIETYARMPVIGMDECVAAGRLVVIDAGDVYGDATAGPGPLYALAVRL